MGSAAPPANFDYAQALQQYTAVKHERDTLQQILAQKETEIAQLRAEKTQHEKAMKDMEKKYEKENKKYQTLFGVSTNDKGYVAREKRLRAASSKLSLEAAIEKNTDKFAKEVNQHNKLFKQLKECNENVHMINALLNTQKAKKIIEDKRSRSIMRRQRYIEVLRSLSETEIEAMPPTPPLAPSATPKPACAPAATERSGSAPLLSLPRAGRGLQSSFTRELTAALPSPRNSSSASTLIDTDDMLLEEPGASEEAEDEQGETQGEPDDE